MFIDEVLKWPYLTEFNNTMIYSKETASNKDGRQWSLGKPEDLCS